MDNLNQRRVDFQIDRALVNNLFKREIINKKERKSLLLALAKKYNFNSSSIFLNTVDISEE